MKHLHKFASVLLALAMALSLMVPAFASGTAAGDPAPKTDNFTITINTELKDHTYEAYQIFKGDLDKENDTLSNVEWGTGVTDGVVAEFGNAAEKAASLTDENVADFAQAVAEFLSETVAGTSTAKADGSGYEITGLEPGYYLVKDKDDTVPGDSSYTTYILHIVADATVTPKNPGTPEPDKTVGDKNDTDGGDTIYGTTADHDIGDNVPYVLKATLPNTVEAYDKYTLVFEDTMSAGLEYNKDAVVKIGGVKIDESAYKLTYDEVDGGAHKLTISFDDVKAAPVNATNNSVITVEYTAKLTAGAVIGNPGNPNTLVLKYSNNPNSQGEGEDEPTGTTPPKTAVVFTFETVINKVHQTDTDADGKPVFEALEGAEFTLSKLIKGEDGTTQTWTELKTIKDVTTFTFSGLDDGRYMLEESKTPDGYNTIDPIYFTIEAVHALKDDGTEGEVTDLKVYETDKDGNKLTENTKADFTVNLTKTEDYNSGSAVADVVNRSGATLPETGGIGTTIFYTVGGILVAGAVILLVTKKRMSAEK